VVSDCIWLCLVVYSFIWLYMVVSMYAPIQRNNK
jgi:hypothetical protein